MLQLIILQLLMFTVVNSRTLRRVANKVDEVKNHLRGVKTEVVAHLNYYGYKVNGNTQVIQVNWGIGSYDPLITSTGTPSMSSFLKSSVADGALTSWLNSEYATATQSINKGTFAGMYTITPSAAASGATIMDASVISELNAQIAAGNIPAPALDALGNAITYYAIFFPKGKTINDGTGALSCTIFCAYHGTVAAAGTRKEYFYGIHPDMQTGGPCATGCGSTGSSFGNACSVASHELVEMITDPEIGLNTAGTNYLAWYDLTNGEIGDICNAVSTTYVGCDGATYSVQTEWSNLKNLCVGYIGAKSCTVTTPSISPIIAPSRIPSGKPVGTPSAVPVSKSPSGKPIAPSISPSDKPVVAPSIAPIIAPSISPSGKQVASPSFAPIIAPSISPSGKPVVAPSIAPISKTPSLTPVFAPSLQPVLSSAILNGGFDTGFTSWSVAGTVSAVTTGCQSGSCIRVGATTAIAQDSSLSQTFTPSAGQTLLSFWWYETCTDTVTYDWATATLTDNAAVTTSTILVNTCTLSTSWTQVIVPIIAGRSYTLTLINHQDNLLTTNTLFDSVALIAPTVGSIANGGFETGSTSWTAAGTTSIATGTKCRTGVGCGMTGSFVEPLTITDSYFTQLFTPAAGQTILSFWYFTTCNDVSAIYDYISATLTDNTAVTTSTILAKTCKISTSWTQVTVPIIAGHSYTLKLLNHDDGTTYPTYSVFDDVSLIIPAPNAVLNPGFEAGSTSWTAAGTTSIATGTKCRTGVGCGMAGSTVEPLTITDSYFTQTFTPAAGQTILSFWYFTTCNDVSAIYDYVSATLTDNTAVTTSTILAKTCKISTSWTQVTVPIIAGHSYTLKLLNHDDGTTYPTYSVFDDVSTF